LKQFAAGMDWNFGEKGDTNVTVNVDVSLALEKIYGNAERGTGNAETIEIGTTRPQDNGTTGLVVEVKDVRDARDEKDGQTATPHPTLLGTREDARPPVFSGIEDFFILFRDYSIPHYSGAA
jgi:hypothetical protein